MAVKVRCAQLEFDQTELIALFKRYLTPDYDERRFDWLYKKNPCGIAQAWVALDTEKGAVIGAAAAFPRNFHLGGAKSMGLVLGDFCFAEGYRSMGPALQLQRSCLEAVAPPYDFCYDFPSNSMMAIYKRLGLEPTSGLTRWAKPLRIEENLRRVIGSKRAANVFGVIANPLLSWRGWKGHSHTCDVQVHAGPCTAEFTMLDQTLSKSAGFRAERTAQFLNWRYVDNPVKKHHILVARQNGVLLGYAVVNDHANSVRIVDVVSVEERGVIARLIEGAVRYGKARGTSAISLVAGECHPWSALFQHTGFLRRETSPIVLAARTGSSVEKTDFHKSCYLMEGERDI